MARQDAGTYAALGFDLLKNFLNRDAITVFRRLVDAYPDVHNYYQWLADAYEKNENYNVAIDSLQKAIKRSDSRSPADIELYQQRIELLKAKVRD